MNPIDTRLAWHLALVLAFIGLCPVALASVYTLPPPGIDVIGQNKVVYAHQQDTLMDIARRYDVGNDEILMANPKVDRWLPGEGTPVVLPLRHILPNAPRQGIVLNLPEKRLYYFPQPKPGEAPVVMTFPVGIGRMDWKTPLGETRVVAKIKDPPWYPPASIKKEHLEQLGEKLPDVIPPGPDDPLGPFALRLGIPGYLIHGTDKPDGVGSRVSHGCVRLYNEDITRLFGDVPPGTPVNIVDQPVKVGIAADTVFLQAYGAFGDDDGPNQATFEAAMQALSKKAGGLLTQVVNMAKVQHALTNPDGLVVPIAKIQ